VRIKKGGEGIVSEQKSCAETVHEAIIALDSELAVASDGENRQRLVRAAYALRNLEGRNWEVTEVFSKDKVFYSLCEDDILEVANAEGEELTPDEMTRVKAGVEKGLGNCWWDIVESAIDDVVSERRQENGRS